MSLIDRQIVETLERFAANVVHEINSPLGTALAATNIALRLTSHSPPSQMRDWLLRSAASIRTASELANGLHRIGFGSINDVMVCELQEIVTTVANVTRNEASTQKCQISIKELNEPMHVIGNPRSIVLAVLRVTYCAIDSGIDHMSIHARADGKGGELCMTLLPNKLFRDEWRVRERIHVHRIIKPEGVQLRVLHPNSEVWSIHFVFPVFDKESTCRE